MSTPTLTPQPVNEYVTKYLNYLNAVTLGFAKGIQAAQVDITEGNHIQAVNDLALGAAQSAVMLMPEMAPTIAAAYTGFFSAEALISSTVGLVRAMFHHGQSATPAPQAAPTPAPTPAVTGVN